MFFCVRHHCTRFTQLVYTHERSRTTKSTVVEHSYHKDRRQLQLFQRLALRQGGASFHKTICQHTFLAATSIAGLSARTMEQRRHVAMAVPTDQLSHNHCDCTDSHCNSHIVGLRASVCSCVTLPSQVHRQADSFYFLKPLGTMGLTLCHLSRQDTS